MAIPESQLETWSHQGSITQSKETYATIRNALLDPKAAYSDQQFEVFLQGSYANDTNIYAESDVDVVIQLDSIYHGNVSSLNSAQLAKYNQRVVAATYSFYDFKNAVIEQLRKSFGNENVVPGNKAVIKPSGSRRSADVIICFEYRRYTSDNDYISGIIFPSTSHGEIINYSKRHSENCTAKHQMTKSWFKPMVRIFKNLRTRLENTGKIKSGTAPSYYIEGMLYNIPTENFGKSYGDTFVNCVNWLHKCDRSKLICANEQYYLLGNGNVEWPAAHFETFLAAAIELWNNW